MDACKSVTYMPSVNRILLALLALMTGLAAQVAPAEARLPAGDAEVGSVAACKAAAPLAVVAAPIVRPVSRQVLLRTECAAPVVRQIAAPAPAVLPGIDRARE
jgi:hypothetical protein